MYTSSSGDIAFFVTAILAGAVLAFLYDLIRISRRIVPTNASGVCFEDILFLALAAVILFYAAYIKNHGQVRWQGFLGCGIGLGAYWRLIRNRFVNLGTAFVRWLICALLWLFRALMLPIKIVFRAIKKPIEIVAWYTGARLRRIRQAARFGKARAKMRIKAALSLAKKK